MVPVRRNHQSVTLLWLLQALVALVSHNCIHAHGIQVCVLWWSPGFPNGPTLQTGDVVARQLSACTWD